MVRPAAFFFIAREFTATRKNLFHKFTGFEKFSEMSYD
jgi:hypothetical protein